jgi:hypothetical protein
VCRQIQYDADTCDRFEFLRWPSLNNFSVPEEWIPQIWYTTLLITPCWSTKWFPLTRDTKVLPHVAAIQRLYLGDPDLMKCRRRKFHNEITTDSALFPTMH